MGAMAENAAPGAPEEPRPAPNARKAQLRAHKAAVAVRRQRVGDLRIAGATFRDIARELGIDVHDAHNDWKKFLASMGPTEDVETYRLIQRERIEERIVSMRRLRSIEMKKAAPSLLDVARLAAVEMRCEAQLQSLLGTAVQPSFPIDAAVGVEVEGRIELSPEQESAVVEAWMKMRTLPVMTAPVIEVEVVHGNGGNGNGG